ncbi:hypothetical protein [Paraconexibacter sp.]|uniref:hypothetical protein n=1 Tax=Paraconexibacter sp. TaxID=2949640 RepID=UPI00356A2797
MTPDEAAPLCSHCGRPLRPSLRGFCARCVTTPRQRRKLGERSPDAMGGEGPVARALDIVLGIGALAIALTVVVFLGLWLGWPIALGAVLVLAIFGAVFVG